MEERNGHREGIPVREQPGLAIAKAVSAQKQRSRDFPARDEIVLREKSGTMGARLTYWQDCRRTLISRIAGKTTLRSARGCDGARYLLDTNICIYIRQKRPETLLRRFQKLLPGEAALSVITFGELLYGAEKSVQRVAALES